MPNKELKYGGLMDEFTRIRCEIHPGLFYVFDQVSRSQEPLLKYRKILLLLRNKQFNLQRNLRNCKLLSPLNAQ